MKQAFGAWAGSIPPPGSSGSENIFVKDARARPAQEHLELCERISKLRFTCPYPPKPTTRAPWAHPTPGQLMCASLGEHVPQEADCDKCGKSLKHARLAHQPSETALGAAAPGLTS